MKDIRKVFALGMTAPEVIVQIVELHPEIQFLLFKIYTSIKNLEEEPVIQIRTSLDRMIHHNPPKQEETIRLHRKKITLERLQEIADGLAGKRALAVTSKVQVVIPRNILHIPMMDFNCQASPENQKKIKEFLKKIGQKRVILFSGRSYHFYGTELLYGKRWFEFLGKCLLFIDYTDSRYIGHKLIDGYSSLRISKEIRRPDLPKVVAIV